MNSHKLTIRSSDGVNHRLEWNGRDVGDTWRSIRIECQPGQKAKVTLTLYGDVDMEIGANELETIDAPGPNDIDVTALGDVRRQFLNTKTNTVRSGEPLYWRDKPRLDLDVVINDPNGEAERKLRRR